MMFTRRNTLHLLGAGCMTGLAGCSSWGIGNEQEYAQITMENNHDTQYMMAVSITTIPDVGSGFTTYFSDVWLLDPREDHTFEEGLAFTDFEPELMALVVLDDETVKRKEFLFTFDLSKLRVIVTEKGQIEVQPQM